MQNDSIKYMPLTEILDAIIDNRGKTVPTSDNGIKLIATNCILNSRLFPIYEKIRYVSKETYDTWFRSHLKPGDIIFVNKGGPGKVCMVPEKLDFCIAQDMVGLRVNNNIVYNKYLFAYLRTPFVQKFIDSNIVGSLIPHFKKEQFKTLMTPILPMKDQIKIGDIYYKMCYKIELNNSISEQLNELITQTFNKYNEELKDYVELDIKDIFDFESGVEPGSKNYLDKAEDNTVKFYRVRDMNSDCKTYVKEELTNGKLIENDDIAVSFDATIGRIGFGISGAYSSGIKKITVNSNYRDIIDNSIVYAYFNSFDIQNLMMENAKGTTILHASSSIEHMKFKYNEELLKKYGELISKSFAIMKKIKMENSELNDLKDLLLPRLIDENLDVTNIEV